MRVKYGKFDNVAKQAQLALRYVVKDRGDMYEISHNGKPWGTTYKGRLL